MENEILIASEINKSFGTLKVLDNVSFSVKRGEFVTIVGPSGVGKTTLLQIISTLASSDSGKVILCGTDISQLKNKETSSFRGSKLGFVFQFHQLLPEFTAVENVMMPALIMGHNEKESRDKAIKLLDRLGIRDRAEHKPNELSGGEKQRVAVARSLINNPEIIFADEPTGSLDTHNRDELQNLLLSLRDEMGLTIVVVTHDNILAERSDRIIKMQDGKIIDQGI